MIKRLDPITLADNADHSRLLLHPNLIKTLADEIQATMDKFLKKLRAKLRALKLSDAHIEQIITTYQLAAKNLGDDEAQHTPLIDQFEQVGKQLAEQLKSSGDHPAPISIQLSQPNGLTQQDIETLLDQREKQRTDNAKALAEQLQTKRKRFTDAIDAAEGLDDNITTTLLAAAELISAEMSDEQIDQLANQQIALGNQTQAAQTLAQQGFAVGAQGSVRILTDGADNAIKQLTETVDKRLGLTTQGESERYARTGGKLQAQNKQLADNVLAQYDVQHQDRLQSEAKALAAGDGVITDTVLPVSFERTVIREALYSLIGLQFVNTGTAPMANSVEIPYSYRDTTAAGKDNTRVYEGQSIPRAGVIQKMDSAYPMPQKLSFEVSDELRYLTADSPLAWEAVGENTRNATRIISEDTDRLIFNEILQSNDEFGAINVVNEDVNGVNGTNRIFPLNFFPVVRPRAIFDLQGNIIGNVWHDVSVSYKGNTINPYDSSRTLAAGTYYRLDFNLGELRLVDEDGALLTPANGDALRISYSYTTNCFAFNVDRQGDEKISEHWDQFLYRFGLRKSLIEDDRYRQCNFGLMRGTVMNQIEQAETFRANFRIPATDLNSEGNLGRIKMVPQYKTTAPGLWMGDQRVVLGQRNETRFRLLKPWAMGQLENQKDENGRFTGKKEAYGDQFIALHTPKPIKDATTSLVLYSAQQRLPRAA